MDKGANPVPLHVNNDPRSVFERISAAEFNNLSTRDVQEKFRKHHIIITDVIHDPVKFDEFGFSTLEKTMKARISIQGHFLFLVFDHTFILICVIITDQSIKMNENDFTEQQKIGTLTQILDASRRECGRILNALDLPRSLAGVIGSQYTSEVSAWRATQDHIFCNEKYPTSDNYWELVATRGARSWIHIDADGLGTRFEVACGAKWIVIGRPPLDDDPLNFLEFLSDRSLFTGDFAVDDASSVTWEYEAVYLSPGTAL